MDLDTLVPRSYRLNVSLQIFEQGKTDILIQVHRWFSRLDFDHVSVVGILNADTMLNYPDFRSYERAFSVDAASGRTCGRKNKRGRVILQTKVSITPIIAQVIHNDFDQMVGDSLLNVRCSTTRLTIVWCMSI